MLFNDILLFQSIISIDYLSLQTYFINLFLVYNLKVALFFQPTQTKIFQTHIIIEYPNNTSEWRENLFVISHDIEKECIPFQT